MKSSKHKQPIVSVILPNYNYQKYIGQAIQSVLNQSFTDWELIIIDDGSNDDSVIEIKKYLKISDKIRFFNHPNNENKGLLKTYQLGIEKSTGQYIAFLEADDHWEKDNLKIKINALKGYPDIPLIFSDVYPFTNNQKKTNDFDNNNLKQKIKLTNLKNHIFFENPIKTFSTVIIKKEKLNKLNFDVPKRYYLLLDWWLWFQIILTQKVLQVKLPLVNWRIHSDSQISKFIDSGVVGPTYVMNYLRVVRKTFLINWLEFSIFYLVGGINSIIQHPLIALVKLLRIFLYSLKLLPKNLHSTTRNKFSI